MTNFIVLSNFLPIQWQCVLELVNLPKKPKWIRLQMLYSTLESWPNKILDCFLSYLKCIKCTNHVFFSNFVTFSRTLRNVLPDFLLYFYSSKLRSNHLNLVLVYCIILATLKSCKMCLAGVKMWWKWKKEFLCMKLCNNWYVIISVNFLFLSDKELT